MSVRTSTSGVVRWHGRYDELSAADRRALLDRSAGADDSIRERTAEVVGRVRTNGDDALRALALTFDGVSLNSLEVPREAWQRALQLDPGRADAKAGLAAIARAQ